MSEPGTAAGEFSATTTFTQHTAPGGRDNVKKSTFDGRMAPVLLVAWTVAGCSDPAAPPVDRCTQQFNLFFVTVLDAAGEPAEDVDIAVHRVEDGTGPIDPQFPRDLTEVNDFSLSTPGLYVLLTDRNLDDLNEVGPTAIEVVGTLGDAGFTAEYVFNRDACHVWKVSGPDTVQLEPLPLG